MILKDVIKIGKYNHHYVLFTKKLIPIDIIAAIKSAFIKISESCSTSDKNPIDSVICHLKFSEKSCFHCI